MRVLLDECARALRAELPGHEVKTVAEAGWAGVKNGALLQLAAMRFDVLLTVDRNLERSAYMNLALALLFTLLLSMEALWLFALSAHIARVMETVAPLFWIVALVGVWFAYSRGRSLPPRGAAIRTFTVGVSLIALGAVLGAIAIVKA